MGHRSTVDLVVLILTVTVCGVLVLVAVAVTVAGAIPPNDPIAGRYLDVVMTAAATMLGALLGLLAGRKTSPAVSATTDDPQVGPPR